MVEMKEIVFDLDGVICTQTNGDYEKAEPKKEDRSGVFRAPQNYRAPGCRDLSPGGSPQHETQDGAGYEHNLIAVRRVRPVLGGLPPGFSEFTTHHRRRSFWRLLLSVYGLKCP